MPKFDAFRGSINQNDKVRRIGIALNGLERLDNVTATCTAIRSAFPHVELVVRPHPMLYSQAELRPGYLALERQLKQIPGVSISDPRKQSIFEYLKEIDLLIGGDSNIHLEATMLNVYCIYYSDTDYHDVRDWYGFIQNGMITEATSVPHLLNCIGAVVENKPNVRGRAKHYCESVETEMDGKSAAFAASILAAQINQDDVAKKVGLYLPVWTAGKAQESVK